MKDFVIDYDLANLICRACSFYARAVMEGKEYVDPRRLEVFLNFSRTLAVESTKSVIMDAMRNIEELDGGETPEKSELFRIIFKEEE